MVAPVRTSPLVVGRRTDPVARVDADPGRVVLADPPDIDVAPVDRVAAADDRAVVDAADPAKVVADAADPSDPTGAVVDAADPTDATDPAGAVVDAGSVADPADPAGAVVDAGSVADPADAAGPVVDTWAVGDTTNPTDPAGAAVDPRAVADATDPTDPRALSSPVPPTDPTRAARRSMPWAVGDATGPAFRARSGASRATAADLRTAGQGRWATAAAWGALLQGRVAPGNATARRRTRGRAQGADGGAAG